ncbi:unnamed protein product [Protopolystoma xenopodis]|uniref:STI1 domain-containing protein n=1 Tax=Protopolystoma xenopodis TaxID=117903 RepID=A0A3S5B9R7_9PLAT|nr:unnamed protein product [Protopolystoma xenopodis]
MERDKVEQLKAFVTLLKSKPDTIHLPDLGASLSRPANGTGDKQANFDMPTELESESEESDLVEQPMGDPLLEVTEEMEDESDSKRMEGQMKLSEGDIQGAIDIFTEAILKNPLSALLHTRRGHPEQLLRIVKKLSNLMPTPLQPIKSEDLLTSNRVPCIYFRMLGSWEDAYNDLQLSLKLDYSEDAYEAIKLLEPKHKLIIEHKRKYERKREDKLDKQRRERARKAREAAEQAYKDNDSGPSCPDNAEDIFSDPELTASLQDPEVMAAFVDLMKNPSSISKYASNPKIMKSVTKLKNFGGGMGGFPGMPGMGVKPESRAPGPTSGVPRCDDLD